MPDRDSGLARFDARDRLDMHAQAGGCRGLPLARLRARQPGSGAHVLDGPERIATDVRGDALALGHGSADLPQGARCWWIMATAAAPSPIAAPTRLVDPLRTSPTANTPGRL